MSARAWLIVAGAAVLAVLIAAVISGPSVGDRPTVRSARPAGLLAAFRYLEARGYPVERWERPLDRLALGQSGTLVIAAPFTVVPGSERVAHLKRWVSAGGRLVLLTSGQRPAAAESLLLSGLQLDAQDLGNRPPLSWSGWRDWVTGGRRLVPSNRRPEGARYPDAELVSAEVSHVVPPARGAEILFEDTDGTAAVFRERYGDGWLVVVNDSSVLANENVAEAGNLALVEAIAAEGASPGGEPGTIWFCEWLHGFRAADAVEGGRAGALAWIALHALLVYAACVWRMARRFGPPPREVSVPESSLRRDVEALASLHERARHPEQAGARLLELARRAASDGRPPEGLDGSFRGGERELVALARRIGRLQRDGEL